MSLVQNSYVPKHTWGIFSVNNTAQLFWFKPFAGMYLDKRENIFSPKVILLESIRLYSLNILNLQVGLQSQNAVWKQRTESQETLLLPGKACDFFSQVTTCLWSDISLMFALPRTPFFFSHPRRATLICHTSFPTSSTYCSSPLILLWLLFAHHLPSNFWLGDKYYYYTQVNQQPDLLNYSGLSIH